MEKRTGQSRKNPILPIGHPEKTMIRGFKLVCTSIMILSFAPANGLEFNNVKCPILEENYFKNVPEKTTNLSFSNCDVTYVEYFAFDKFENMTILSITGSYITTFNIAPNQLRILDLSVNQITYIDDQLLLNSPNLTQLYLERNNLKSIDWNLNAHFNLQKVILNENQITTINLISPTLQELWIKREDGRVQFSATSKMEQLTFLETSETETDADLCWLSNFTLKIQSTQEVKLCKNSTNQVKNPINFGNQTHSARDENQLSIIWFCALSVTIVIVILGLGFICKWFYLRTKLTYTKISR